MRQRLIQQELTLQNKIREIEHEMLSLGSVVSAREIKDLRTEKDALELQLGQVRLELYGKSSVVNA